MKVTMKSALSGKENSMELDITPAQLKDWQSGTLIQRAMPNLTANEREFLMTGITREEWDELFPDED